MEEKNKEFNDKYVGFGSGSLKSKPGGWRDRESRKTVEVGLLMPPFSPERDVTPSSPPIASTNVDALALVKTEPKDGEKGHFALIPAGRSLQVNGNKESKADAGDAQVIKADDSKKSSSKKHIILTIPIGPPPAYVNGNTSKLRTQGNDSDYHGSLPKVVGKKRTLFSKSQNFEGLTLLLVDIQIGVTDKLSGTHELLSRAGRVLQLARIHGINIIHVNTAFRLKYPEAHPNNAVMQGIAAAGAYQQGHRAVHLHPAVEPLATEATITKRRTSAFFGTDLDILLRASGTNKLVIGGLVTSGAILSTVRFATDSDYKVVLLRDMCMDQTPGVHDFLMNFVFSRHADVVTAETWIKNTFSSQYWMKT